MAGYRHVEGGRCGSNSRREDYAYGMVNRDALLDEAGSVAAKLTEQPRFAMSRTRQACDLVDDIQGNAQQWKASSRCITGLARIIGRRRGAAFSCLVSHDRNSAMVARYRRVLLSTLPIKNS